MFSRLLFHFDFLIEILYRKLVKGNQKINTIDLFGHILHQAEKSRHETKLTLANKIEVKSNNK